MEVFPVFLSDKKMCIVEAHHFDITHGLLQFYNEEKVMLSFFKMNEVKSCIHQKSYSRDEMLSQLNRPYKI